MGTIGKPAGGESVVDKAKHTATDLADAARGKLSDAVTDKANVQRDRAASGLGSVAQAIRQTGTSLGDEAGLPTAVTSYVGRAAEGVEKLGDYLDGKELGDIVSDVERFARREPALFLGGAFVLGLMGARFLKSSARRSTSYDASYDRSFDSYQRPYPSYEDRYGASSSFAREPRFDSMQHTATPTPMAPPRRDPTMNTSGNGNGNTPAVSSTPITPIGGPRGGTGSTGNT